MSKKNKLSVQLPVRIEVRDYHDFPEVEDHLKKLIPTIKVKEIGCGYPIDRSDWSGAYHGIAYVGSLSRHPANIELVKEIKEHCRQDDEA